jgi:hypothetical protein
VRVLLDEDLPHQLRHHIPNHEVFTVSYMGWKGLKNGELLGTAEEAGFDVFVTGDKKLVSQQNLKGRNIGAVVLSAQKIDQLRPHLQAIIHAINQSEPGTACKVDCDTGN